MTVNIKQWRCHFAVFPPISDHICSTNWNTFDFARAAVSKLTELQASNRPARGLKAPLRISARDTSAGVVVSLAHDGSYHRPCPEGALPQNATALALPDHGRGTVAAHPSSVSMFRLDAAGTERIEAEFHTRSFSS
jgi:hypothetical protein